MFFDIPTPQEREAVARELDAKRTAFILARGSLRWKKPPQSENFPWESQGHGIGASPEEIRLYIEGHEPPVGRVIGGFKPFPWDPEPEKFIPKWFWQVPSDSQGKDTCHGFADSEAWGQWMVERIFINLVACNR